MLGSLKTFSGLACALIVASSLEPRGTETLRLFASCAGRLSATEEHQRMFNGPASEQTAIQLGRMMDLTEAAMAKGQGRQALDWHIQAKFAHAGLLNRATFSQDTRTARQAERLARNHLTTCTRLLPG